MIAQLSSRLEPFRRITPQELHHHARHDLRDSPTRLFDRPDFTAVGGRHEPVDLIGRLVRYLPEPRVFAREERIEHDAQGEQVRSTVDGLCAQLLGSRVAGRPE